MINLALVIFIILGNISEPNFTGSPEDAYAHSSSNVYPGCTEEEDSNSSLEPKRPERTRSFRLTGAYICQRDLFEYGQRNSFVDFITLHLEDRSKEIAQAVTTKLSTSRINIPVFVHVELKDPALANLIKSSLLLELAKSLGASGVSRNDPEVQPDDGPTRVVFVKLHMLQDSRDFLEASLKFNDGKGVQQWIPL